MHPVQLVGYLVLTVVTFYGAIKTMQQLKALIDLIAYLIVFGVIAFVAVLLIQYPHEVIAFLESNAHKAINGLPSAPSFEHIQTTLNNGLEYVMQLPSEPAVVEKMADVPPAATPSILESVIEFVTQRKE